MNIVMFTNVYTPHVGGVERSVAAFAQAYRRLGHRVLVVAPEFPGQPQAEQDVLRLPAIQNFNGSDFSMVLPLTGLLTDALDAFQPDLVHSHHPYLLGSSALRIARYREVPLVFTHHTQYEHYTHYVPVDSPALKRFVIELATCYANLCDQVFAPSESIADLLHERGVTAPIAVMPTGVEVDRFVRGDGRSFRASLGIPDEAFVVGHVGRLAPEKNLEFLAEAVIAFLRTEPCAHFLLVGKGPSESTIETVFAHAGLSERLHHVGILEAQGLTDAYHAMDVFAFASRSETQGMVLTEAMAAGVAVVALDAPGARETVMDGRNGRLLHTETVDSFRAALQWVAGRTPEQRRELGRACQETGLAFSMDRCAERALSIYQGLLDRDHGVRHQDDEPWTGIANLIQAEWDLLVGKARALGAAFADDEAPRDNNRP
ncbi:MAG: glycosyl transferase family 1 [Methylomonas sp.]|nr:MAG: glycosyl transferase family 1 [Methylomonas sp.]PPD26978.1 MAG: glycosyl transferase family 1 [Methylomonas sp.]PPD38917.1 MAG: glycosyl transferase family 1 [Methylomonas sp.]PPD42599.1 MAG: glycosyl transferase family 1 [Methylomonas sp.]PPD54129.1 MAG: glycosyl transferase family 1 [Methylomonas sp.]